MITHQRAIRRKNSVLTITNEGERRIERKYHQNNRHLFIVYVIIETPLSQIIYVVNETGYRKTMQFNLSLGKQMFVFIVKLVWSKSWRKKVDGKKSAKKSREKELTVKHGKCIVDYLHFLSCSLSVINSIALNVFQENVDEVHFIR